MAWSVEHTDEFAAWYRSLTEPQQDDITAVGLLLMEQGPQLPFPYSSGVNGSKHAHMRELRVQAAGVRFGCSTPSIRGGRRYLLIGGDKTGDDRFYARMIPVADALYDVHINEIRREGLIP